MHASAPPLCDVALYWALSLWISESWEPIRHQNLEKPQLKGCRKSET
jgi:hypothetical protein